MLQYLIVTFRCGKWRVCWLRRYAVFKCILCAAIAFIQTEHCERHREMKLIDTKISCWRPI